ncbi:HNH endonuclease [Peribacillus butanolivorans]|uniref:HNH endonuclease n=1 Tax=Peribacillus butanolivorans TaxID=421767 RepID=UPI0036DF96F1
MVEAKMAGIVNGVLIHQLYSGKVFKQMVLERDKYTCTYCKEYGSTIDHVIPKSKGGNTSFENCVCACKRCNSQKANLPVEEYKN